MATARWRTSFELAKREAASNVPKPVWIESLHLIRPRGAGFTEGANNNLTPLRESPNLQMQTSL